LFSIPTNRQFCSTAIHRHRPNFNDSFSSPSFKPTSPIERLYESTINDSPTLFKEPANRSKFFSQRLNFDNEFEDEDSSDFDKSYNIGPKNLLSVRTSRLLFWTLILFNLTFFSKYFHNLLIN
jgi:hypothetical protein